MLVRKCQGVMLLLMVGLLGLYFYLDRAMPEYAAANYHKIAAGSPALSVDLRVDDKTVATFRLPASDFFDATGKYQVNFHALDPARFRLLNARLKKLSVSLNGQPVTVKRIAGKQYLLFLLPQKKLYLTREGDTRTIAALAWTEEKHRKDIFACRGSRLCPNIRFAGGAGIGMLDGPYLDTEQAAKRRGMPRGRWAFGPQTTIDIQSKLDSRAILSITALGITKNQQLIFSGPVLKVKNVEKTSRAVNVSGKLFYLKKYLAELHLRPGVNNLAIKYSNWMKATPGEPRQLAAYMMHVNLMEEKRVGK